METGLCRIYLRKGIQVVAYFSLIDINPCHEVSGVRIAMIVETVNRLNVEHRTSNIEHPILMALRFIYFKAN